MKKVLLVIAITAAAMSTMAIRAASAQTTQRSRASLHQLSVRWTDQNGSAFRFSQLNGHPTLIVMFYGSCRYACPRLLGDAKAFENALTPAERGSLHVVFVTFDPDVDTAAALRGLAESSNVDQSRWHFLRGSQSDIRVLANVLGVKYRRIEGGHFSHSNILTLLGATGEILHQVEGLQQPPGELVARLRATQR